MIVLGFDTATPGTAVALALGDGRFLEARDDPPEGRRPGHSTHLLPLARELLEQAGLCWRDLDLIGVGTGPGTFTGLRIGVSTARALAQSLGVALVGVSSSRALAHAHTRWGPEPHAPILAVIDARRAEVFAGAYREGRELVEPRALAPERLGEVLQLARERHEDGDWIAVGDGALRYSHALNALGIYMPPAQDPVHAISGRSVCELARAQADSPPAYGKVVPAYGRAPDAKPAAGGHALEEVSR